MKMLSYFITVDDGESNYYISILSARCAPLGRRN